MLFFFKQKTAYEMRISDWSSDVCSSDLLIYQHKDYSFSLQPSLRYIRQADQLQEADSGVTARATKMLGPTWNITGSVFYTDLRIEPDRSRHARAVGATLGFKPLRDIGRETIRVRVYKLVVLQVVADSLKKTTL